MASSEAIRSVYSLLNENLCTFRLDSFFSTQLTWILTVLKWWYLLYISARQGLMILFGTNCFYFCSWCFIVYRFIVNVFSSKVMFVLQIGCQAQTPDCNVKTGNQSEYKGILLQYTTNRVSYELTNTTTSFHQAFWNFPDDFHGRYLCM